MRTGHVVTVARPPGDEIPLRVYSRLRRVAETLKVGDLVYVEGHVIKSSTGDWPHLIIHHLEKIDRGPEDVFTEKTD